MVESEAFEAVDLASFESESVDSSYSFAGLSLSTRVSEDPERLERSDQSGTGIGVEQFFESCFDSGVRVYPESKFAKGRFIGSGATMAVYEGTWKETGSPVALK